MEDRNLSSTPEQQLDVQRGRSTRIRDQLLAGLPVTQRRLQLNGISTALIEGGEGPPIVLLHGPGGFGASWLRVIPSLVGSHRVIAPDLPGHGASGTNTPMDVQRTIGWLDDLIDCTCKAPPVLCGTTLGGAIAARYASARSERLAGLVLVDALGLSVFQPVPEFGMAIGEYMASPSETTHERLWRQCAFDLATMRDRLGETWERFKAYDIDRARASELKATQESLFEHFVMPAIAPSELAKITVPTSLIWGKNDRATPLSVARAASMLYGWPLHVIDDAGDEPGLEQPDAFLGALDVALRHRPIASAAGGEQAAWNTIAPAYDDFVTPSHLWLGNEAVARAGVTKGLRFLDVAAGSGALSIPAAQRGARVVAIDIAPVMLARLHQRAVAAGLEIETHEMDGHNLAFETDTFDVTGSQFGVMLFPDLPRGLQEMVRVTKPGGRVLVVTFGPPHQIEFFSFFVQAMRAAVPEFAGPPMDPPPLPFQIADAGVLHSRLNDAGLHNIVIDTITETLQFASGLELWKWLLGSNPLATQLTSTLSSEQVPIVQAAMERLIRERAAGNAKAILRHPMHIAVGVK